MAHSAQSGGRSAAAALPDAPSRVPDAAAPDPPASATGASSSASRSAFDSSPFWEPQKTLTQATGPFGRYRILKVIGEGGMGVVYLAEQDNPRRFVALKLIKGGFDSARLLRRLEFEAHVLARLQHPGIAQIIESGVAITPHGPQPYFAMEYIEGVRLTQYVREQGFDTRRRLELLIQVCQAVHHAHQRGVVHRDLKPGNILVTGDGQPKILDFGVAALTDGSFETTTIQTRTGQFVGTLPYMSPEQISGDPRSVDTRTDVYALGVIGYELLAGRLPHDLKDKPLPEAARIIQEHEPPSLSTVNRSLRGEVPRLIGKAMEKDRERRYPSADAFAADIRRYLRDEPIEARGDSALYVLRKYVRRHRWLTLMVVLTASFLVLFALYAGVAAENQRQLAFQESEARKTADAAMRQAMAAEGEAKRERDQARLAREAEEAHRLEAENETRRAQAVTAFLVRTLGLADPDVTQTPDLTIKEMLDAASEEIGSALADQPQAEATVRTVVGRAYATLGDLESAYGHLERALELRRLSAEEEPEALYETLLPYFQVQTDRNDVLAHALGYELQDLGQKIMKRRSEALYEAVIRFRNYTVRGANPFHRDGAFQEALAAAQRDLAPDDPVWLYVADAFYLGSYRIGYRDAPGAACKYLRGALEIQRRFLSETHTRVVRTLSVLITYSLAAGEAENAELLTRQTLGLLAETLPENHWYLHVYRGKLAACLIAQNRQAEAEPMLLSALQGVSAARGENNTYVAEIHKTLAELYDGLGRTASARRHRWMFARCLTGSTLKLSWRDVNPVYMACAGPAFGPELEELAQTVDRFKDVVGTPSEASMDALQDMIALRQRLLADDDSASTVIADLLTEWSEAYRTPLPSQTSKAMLNEAICIYNASPHDNPRKAALAHFWLGAEHEALGEFVEGESQARAALEYLAGITDQDYGFTAVAQSLLGGCLLGQGRFDEAQPLLVAAFDSLRRSLGPGNGNTIVAFGRLLKCCKAAGRTEEAGPVIRDFLRQFPASKVAASATTNVIRRVIHDPCWTTEAYAAAGAACEYVLGLLPEDAGARARLGIALYRQGRFEAALASLDEGDRLFNGTSGTTIAYQAMTLERLGRRDEALAALARMEDRIDRLADPVPDTAEPFAEARRVLGIGSSGPDDPPDNSTAPR